MKLTKGTILTVIDNSNLSASIGATARVTRDHVEGDFYVYVKWLTNSRNQHNGGYFIHSFRTISEVKDNYTMY